MKAWRARLHHWGNLGHDGELTAAPVYEDRALLEALKAPQILQAAGAAGDVSRQIAAGLFRGDTDPPRMPVAFLPRSHRGMQLWRGCAFLREEDYVNERRAFLSSASPRVAAAADPAHLRLYGADRAYAELPKDLPLPGGGGMSFKDDALRRAARGAETPRRNRRRLSRHGRFLRAAIHPEWE
eukprot:Polyplicarium_translucidae@DN3650_c0_g1_i2.p2